MSLPALSVTRAVEFLWCLGAGGVCQPWLVLRPAVPCCVHIQDVASLTAAAEAAQAELSTQLSALHARWLAREPRPEDVTAIAELRSLLDARDEAVRVAEEQLAQLRAQMLLREDNYNKHFKWVVPTVCLPQPLLARRCLHATLTPQPPTNSSRAQAFKWWRVGART